MQHRADAVSGDNGYHLELLPAKPPSERGQGRNGKSATAGVVDFNPSVISAYRKIAANREKLESYCAEVDDVPTQGGFLQYVAGGEVSGYNRYDLKLRWQLLPPETAEFDG